MRVVVDTNIFVSAALKSQSLPVIAILRAVEKGTLLKSRETEAQLLQVLARPRLAALFLPGAVEWCKIIIGAAQLIDITETVQACRDSTDDKFLALAVNGRADIILSGDADLLVLNPFRGIAVLDPASFLRTTPP
jgi:putative PIN family toxin of toxin-antitoxin system